jgi:hydrogenase expression/formation protein HypC
MCLAIPGKVESIQGTTATIDVMGVKRDVAIDLFPHVSVGDYLMVHAGYVIEKVDMEEAEQTIALYQELGMLMAKDGYA